LVDVARQRYEAQEAFYMKGRITIDRIADASLQLAEAELRTARTPYERVAIKKRHSIASRRSRSGKRLR
jgi:hypothetical protein